MFSIALPSLEQLNHALTEHLTLECDQNIPTHVHKGEYSCDFQTLHLAKVDYPNLQSFDVYQASFYQDGMHFYYESFNLVNPTYFSLRGPPVTA